MSPYQIADEAIDDFFDALDFIASYSPQAASGWQARMLQAFDVLGEWPQSGKIRPEFAPPSVRFWIEGDFVVLYDPSSTPLAIIAVLQGAQDLTTLIAKRVEDYDYEEETEETHA